MAVRQRKPKQPAAVGEGDVGTAGEVKDEVSERPASSRRKDKLTLLSSIGIGTTAQCLRTRACAVVVFSFNGNTWIIGSPEQVQQIIRL